MLIGNALMNGMTAYSEWYTSLGEAATFGCRVHKAANTAELAVTVQTKNADELDSAAVTATNGSISGLDTDATTTSQRVTGLKQLWRCKYQVTIGTTSSSETFVHFDMLQPIWESNRERTQAVLPAPHAPGMIGGVLVRDTAEFALFTPWGYSVAENATFASEVLDLPTNNTFAVTVQHKNVADNDNSPGSPTGGTITFSSGAEVKSTRATVLKQMFRYKLALSGSASVGQVHYRLLEPMFEPH